MDRRRVGGHLCLDTNSSHKGLPRTPCCQLIPQPLAKGLLRDVIDTGVPEKGGLYGLCLALGV